MSHAQETVKGLSPPSQEKVVPGTIEARPPEGEEAIARIAALQGAPRELVSREFWSAWDALLVDARIPDFMLVLTERKVVNALRREKQTHH
ncbi:MAG: DUF3562 domain-containing protein [Betaproteobacteria bacterium]|nr:DUF3562 domain-containing protein [Betaproteobacteria bacterium]